MSVSFDAVILAGGAGRRLGGVDKPALEVDGVSLLDRALAAAEKAERVIVVGERRPTRRAVEWVMEDPPKGGPAAALSAGLARVQAPRVVVLAADLPFVDTATVERLLSEPASNAVAVDGDGRAQPLLAAYETERLRSALEGDQHNRSLRDAMAGLGPAEVPVGRAATDCDTWEDFERAGGVVGGT